MELIQSNVIFDPELHTYTLDGVQLTGITGMINRQLFPDKYKEVPEHILQRAAERGTNIHTICELIDDLNINDGSEESLNYIMMKAENELHYECSEYIVTDREYFASPIDKVFRVDDKTFDLGDIKTTYSLDEEYLRWQLSIYAYLFELQNPGATVRNLYGIWLRKDKYKLVKVDRIDSEEVKRLMTCEIRGEKYTPGIEISNTTLPKKYADMEASICEIDKQEKYWKEQKKKLLDGICKEMESSGVKKWEGESIKFTRKEDSLRQVFDREAFEKDYPGVYEKYVKMTLVKGSVTLKIK